jgi:putative membrane protein
MKSTILVTAITILAFNMNAGHKKSACLNLHDVSAYIQAIAVKDKMSVRNGFATAEDTFVLHAIKGNREEIMMSQTALQKSTNPQVKALAQHLIDDHQQLLQDLEKLNNSGNQMNNMSDSTPDSSQQMTSNNLSGNAFDRQWVSDMIAGHMKTINEFKTELGKTQNADIKNLITKSLPAISEHLRQLEALRNKMM